MSKVLERIKDRIPPYRKRMIRISVDIGTQIHEYMKSDGINQRVLAEKLGKKESEISKWLSGSHNFTIETVAKIEDVFGKRIILVPLYATQDLGYTYEMKVTVNSSVSDAVNRPLWSFGHTYPLNSSVGNDYNSETLTTQSVYGKAK
jgi:transcriptional regulator with XRE-family HTH domain